MRHYELDNNGFPVSSYSRMGVPADLKGSLTLIPDQPSEHHRWDGEQWVEDEASKRREQELARIPELRESILDQIAMGETPDPALRDEYRQLRQKHPRVAGEESTSLDTDAVAHR